jgi:hypothetical protein
MVSRRVSRSPSFAESVAELEGPTDGPGPSTPVVNLAQSSEIKDPDGVVWRRRGDLVADKRVRKLLSDSTVRVLHDYMGDVQEVPAGERKAFWESAQEKMRKSPHSDFLAAEFKNESREHLLVIHEYC